MNNSMEVISALQVRIAVEENLPLAYAAILAENALCRFDKRMHSGVMQWLEGTLEDSFTVENISLADIQHEMGGSLFQALSVMDIYLKNPDFVPAALWQEERDIVGGMELNLDELISAEDLEDESKE